MNKKTFILLLSLFSLFLWMAAGCSSAKNTGEAIEEGAEEVADKTEDAAEATGEAVKEGAEKVGEKTLDASITAAIKMKLASDDLTDALDIDVDTSDGFVTLNGSVSSQAEADRAVALAQQAEGVKGVKSNLVIAPPQ